MVNDLEELTLSMLLRNIRGKVDLFVCPCRNFRFNPFSLLTNLKLEYSTSVLQSGERRLESHSFRPSPSHQIAFDGFVPRIHG